MGRDFVVRIVKVSEKIKVMDSIMGRRLSVIIFETEVSLFEVKQNTTLP